MATIKINCDCGKSFDVTRHKEAPASAISMGCNWCPVCMDTVSAHCYYEEWYNESDSEDRAEPTPDNQLMLFTGLYEIINQPLNHETINNE